MSPRTDADDAEASGHAADAALMPGRAVSGGAV